METIKPYRLRGLKFYRYEDPNSDTPTILRLVGYDEVKKEYEFRKCDNMEEKVKLPFDEVMTKWIKLNPDGVICFDICTALDNQGQEVPDVMVRLHKVNDGIIENIPYCVCRQAVIDIFVLLQDNTRYVAGMCISRDTCPPELDYGGCFAFHKMSSTDEVAVYMDDHLSDILRVINTKKFDRRLELIKSRDKMEIQGYMTNLYDLLKENYFMLDFHKAFGIHELKFESFDFEDKNTNRVLTDYIIANLHEVPTKLYPIPYSKYIDLRDIRRKYILICPFSYDYPDGNITLLAYDVSATISYKEMVNSGKSPKEAKKEAMRQLGWT